MRDLMCGIQTKNLIVVEIEPLQAAVDRWDKTVPCRFTVEQQLVSYRTTVIVPWNPEGLQSLGATGAENAN